MALLISVIAACDGSHAHAQPQLRVRAESRLEVHEDVQDDRLIVGGTLHDDLGAPLAKRFLTVWLEVEDDDTRERRQEVRTDARGSFRATFARSEGVQRAVVHFDGDASHDGSRVERAVGTGRGDVRLRIHAGAGGQMELSRPDHEVIVWATSRAGAEDLRIVLRDENDEVLGRATTDASGRALFRVASDAFDGPGPGRLHARSEGDERRREAHAQVPILRQRRAEITVEAPRPAPSEGVIIQGTLTDGNAALPERAVGLFTEGGDHLSTTLTDAQGRFTLRLSTQDLAAAGRGVRARFDGDGSGATAVRSEPITLPRIDPRPTPWTWLLLPMLATALLLAWLRLGRRPSRPSEGARPEGEVTVGVAPGIAMARSRERWDVAGRVIDPVRGQPVASATATAVGSDGSPRPLPVDVQGCFQFDDLPGGELSLRVEAPGYAPVEASLRLPHRGEWSRAVVRLESLRSRALAAFRRAATRLVPGFPWGTWTNREVQARAQARGAGPHFDRLTDRVERIYYGRTHPTGDDVEEVEATADAAVAEVPADAHTPETNGVDGRGDASL